MNDKFEGITVEDHGNIVVGRNSTMRVLFRFNKMSESFGVFRSSRMTDDEKEFCVIMQLKLAPKEASDPEKKKELIGFLNYETDFDTYCS